MQSGSSGINQKLDVRRVKTRSGEIYLCPVGILDFIDELTEKELKEICVQESSNWELN